MAKIDFNALETQQVSSNNSNQVGFLTLKNDGDEAIVRFMHDSVDSFDILTVHPIKLNDKYRSVSCIRGAQDPVDNCPLCRAGSQIKQRIFIHMIQYVRDESGNIIAEPKVWERNPKYAKTLKSYIDNYGPLSDIICKIIRHGKAGSMDTDYEIVPNLSKQIYRDDLYPKHEEMFANYSALGRVVFDKTFDEISEFMATGNFPQRASAAEVSTTDIAAPRYQTSTSPQYQAPAPQYSTVTSAPAQVVPNVTNTPVATTPTTTGNTPEVIAKPQQTMPWEVGAKSGTPVARPQRYY